MSKLTKNNFRVEASQSFNDELTDQLDIIKRKDIRIILGNFNHTWARHVFCKAHEENMFGRKYQWLIAGVYPEDWWLHPDSPCPTDKLKAALKGAIVMETTSLATSNQPTALNIVSSPMKKNVQKNFIGILFIFQKTETKLLAFCLFFNQTSEEFDKVYKERSSGMQSSFNGYAFDGIYALAKALDDVSKVADLRVFQYNNLTWQNWLIERLHQTSFNGVTVSR